ncbi:MAG: hypothetical protein OQK10_06680 [Marinobacter sp.]|jgi:hypothetical protein|nr:hypothetical protein [Marinobacter sp.]|tara:strand:- start:137 stop:721 length:585 start_codon:yes stop_codon:yes gene_type:complete
MEKGSIYRLLVRKLVVVTASVFVLGLIPGLGVAEEPKGQLTEDQKKQLERTAEVSIKAQFKSLYDRGIENASSRIGGQGGIKPFAVAMTPSGESRAIRIKQAESMPADVALEVLRRSLGALAKQGKLAATAVFYVTDNPNSDASNDRVLIAEMEHILGPHLAQVTPYRITKGTPEFGEPAAIEVPSQIFNQKDE